MDVGKQNNSATEFIKTKAYDSTTVSQALSNMELELQDEKDLQNALGDPLKVKDDAIKFKANNGLLVRSQATRLKISHELEEIVLHNNTCRKRRNRPTFEERRI